MRRIWIFGGTAAVLLGAIYLINASWLAPVPEGHPGVLAHRGVHQTYHREGMTDETCTAARIFPPTNPYLEHTIASMNAGFAAGASMLELDIHPTKDGEFVVFHDWTLECRTNGHGVTREETSAYLKTLDIGYGYTADGGKTYPFRGRGIGLMPTLNEVLAAFPDKRFVLHIKSNDASEADKLVAYLKAHQRPVDDRLWVFAAPKPGDRLHQLAPRARVMSRAKLKDCALSYLAYGWLGIVPEACRNAFVAVPVDLTWAAWGWPNRFRQRMDRANVVILLAPPQGDTNAEPYISNRAQLDAVPPGFNGFIVTDYIETIGPEVRRRWPESAKPKR